jgi:hypothetical protein
MPLRPAKDIIGQEPLFEGLRLPPAPPDPEVSITRHQKRRVTAAVAAHDRRASSTQDLGYNARPFTVTNLPVRPKTGVQIWERRNGTHYLRIETTNGQLLPYGQDRLVLYLLVTSACQQQSRVVRLGSAADILRLFGKSDAGVNYERLAASFHRIMAASITWGTDGIANGVRLIEGSRMLLLEHFRLWASTPRLVNATGFEGFENVVTLSQHFFDEILAHPIPIDMDVVRGLLDSPAALDFYVWVAYRAKRVPSGSEIRVPLFGPSGLQAQLGSQCNHPRKFRQLVHEWLDLTKVYWRECPVRLSDDRQHLVLAHGQAIRSAPAPSKQL